MKNRQYEHLNKSESYHWWFVAKKKFVAIVLNSINFSVKPNILDCGAGTGGMTVFLSGWGNVTGIENNKVAVKLARKKGLKIISQSLNEIKVHKKYDLVTLFDVLYHQGINEKVVINNIKRIMKSNGYLIITDCALPYLWSKHDEEMMARKRFFKNEIEKLVVDNGFLIVRSSYLYFFVLPFTFINRSWQKLFPPKNYSLKQPFFLEKLFLLLSVFESFLFKFINFPLGSSFIVVAKKDEKK